MRAIHSLLALVLGSVSVAQATGPAVYLDDASMSRLRATNPDHYARARKILSSAAELCRARPEEVTYAKFTAQEVSCSRNFLKTSNPPKRQISFRLDTTRYIALVTVTEDAPRLTGASQPHRLSTGPTCAPTAQGACPRSE